MAAGPQWYISRDGQRVGPIEVSQLRHMVSSGQLKPTDHVWREGMAQWAQAGQVKGLFPGSAAAATGAAHPAASAHPAATAHPAHPAPTASANQPARPAPAQPDWSVRSQEDLNALAGASSRPHRSPRAAAQALPSTSRPFDIAVPMTMAGLMLATLFIPWHYASHGFYDGTTGRFISSGVAFSWNLIDNDSKFAVWVIATWVCALAAIILAPILKGIPRGLTLAGVGGIAAIFLLVWLQGERQYRGTQQTLKILGIISNILLLIMMIVSHVRLRGGQSTLIRILQASTGGAAALLLIVQIIIQLADSDAPFRQLKYIKEPWGLLCQITLMLALAGTLTSAVLALIHGAAAALHQAALSVASVTLMYVTLAATTVLMGLFAAAATEEFGQLLWVFNAGFMTFGVMLIFISGAVQTIDGMRRLDWSARPAAAMAATTPSPLMTTPAASAPITALAPATAMSGSDLDHKFARLEALRKAEHITEEEFQQKRKELLKEI